MTVDAVDGKDPWFSRRFCGNQVYILDIWKSLHQLRGFLINHDVIGSDIYAGVVNIRPRVGLSEVETERNKTYVPNGP